MFFIGFHGFSIVFGRQKNNGHGPPRLGLVIGLAGIVVFEVALLLLALFILYDAYDLTFLKRLPWGWALGGGMAELVFW